MNAGIGQPWSLKENDVSRGLDICCCCVRCSLANYLKKVCLQTFFLSTMADEIIDLCGNVKITVDIPKGTKFDQKPISNSWVGAEVRKKFPYTG